MDALNYAYSIQNEAAQLGFDWPTFHGALEKCYEELDEVAYEIEHHDDVKIKEELGDLLFSFVNLARKLDLQPNSLLNLATEKFSKRFLAVKELVLLDGRSLNELSLSDLDSYWERVK